MVQIFFGHAVEFRNESPILVDLDALVDCDNNVITVNN